MALEVGAWVRFADDDPGGLWQMDDHAEYLGPESEHPDAANIHMFRLNDGQVISLYAPFARGLIVMDDMV